MSIIEYCIIGVQSGEVAKYVMSALSGLFILIAISGFTLVSGYFGLVDTPNERKRHLSDVPLVGGLSIYVFLLAVSLFVDVPDIVFTLILCSGILVAVGVFDDIYHLPVRVRFIAQILAVLLMMSSSGLWIRALGLDWINLIELDRWVGIGITIIAMVGLVNAFNLIDGIDGLASGQMLVGLISLSAGLQFLHGEIYRVEWFLVLSSSVFVFFLVNLSLLPVRKVFLGDAGSMLLGYILGWMLIYYSQEPVALLSPVAALWCITLPVIETLSSILRRLIARSSPFSADRGHLHHLLVDSGFGANQVLGIILSLSLIINAVGIIVTLKISAFAGVAFFLVLFMFYLLLVLKPNTVDLSP